MPKTSFINASILHPTDFSGSSLHAFVHALKIGLAIRCKLYIAHIAKTGDEQAWQAFPHVRQILTRWNLLEAGASIDDVAARLGVEVAKVEIAPQDPVRGLVRFLAGHPSDLLVLATQGRDGLPAWFNPSIAEAMSRRAHTQTLFVPAGASGFVDAATGTLHLRSVLFPIDRDPAPGAALEALRSLCHDLGATPEIHLLHVGAEAPTLQIPAKASEIDLRTGDVVDVILGAASEHKADLIVMATAGRHGVMDAFRGSTTERVLRHAPCPVLAIPHFGRTA